MTNVDWMGFVLASVAIVLAPGPGSVFVAKTAAARGARSGQMAVLGIMLGDTCLILLSLVGASALFRAHPGLFHGVRLAGAGYLVYLGLRTMFARPTGEPGVEGKSALSCRQALAITLLNPKAVLFFMAFFPVFIRSGQAGLLGPYAGMFVTFTVISLAYLSALSFVASRVGGAFRASRSAQSVARKICGCVLIGFGVKVAISSR